LQPDPSVKKVLIYRIGSLGDTLVALPSLHLIARSFPGAKRVLLTNIPIHSRAPAAEAVLEGTGLIDEYVGYRIGMRSSGQLLRLAAQIRRMRPEVLVYLMPVRPLKDVVRDRRFFRLAGVRRFIGLPSEEELKHRFDSATGLFESEASRLARAISELGDARPCDLGSWDLRLSEVERDAAARALGELAATQLIACAPGCKMQANDWEKENWRALLGRLSLKFPRHGLMMAGAESEFEICEYAAQDWRGPKVNLAGLLTPRESAAAFSHAQLFLGPDSGPKHLAASVGVACVCVFSARGKPGVWFPPGKHNVIVFHQPECHGCGLETCIEMEKKCIRSVTVEEMESAAVKVMERMRLSRGVESHLPAML
jgi:heptosyltransferase III